MLSVEDHIAITQVLNLYGHLVDHREWGRFGEVFADDAVFDATIMGGGRMEGLDTIVTSFRDPDASHPLAHHLSNIVLTPGEDGTVRAISKGFGPRPEASDSRAVTYRDVLRRTPEGWRIALRQSYVMVPRPNDVVWTPGG